MRTWIYACVLGVLSVLPTLSQAGYLEGIEYARLPEAMPVQTGKKIEVREVFWYGCPHCFHFEPTLQSWLKTKPKNVEFVRMPGVFNDSWEPGARAFYTFEALGLTNKLHEAFFKAIHVENKTLNDEDSITQFAVDHGVDGKIFRNTYHSFGVTTQVKKAMDLGARYGVDSVPTIIVDGKFRTNATMATGASSANTPMLDPNAALMQVVDYLIKKSEAERKGAKTKR